MSIRLRRAARELVRAGIDSVCPPVCPACGVAGEGLCSGCAKRLEVRCAPVCPRCGSPVFAAGAKCTTDHRAFRGLHLARAPFAYRGTGGEIVRRAKFRADRAALDFLARAMADALGGWARGAGRRSVVVPVPLHPSKLRQRGIDQAAVLADSVARRLGLRVAPGTLRRVRRTLPQGDVRVTSRAGNVAGAFTLRAGWWPRIAARCGLPPGSAAAARFGAATRCAGRTVVLVDDVRTSGSTAMECARVLADDGGAERVVLLTAVQA